MANSKEIHPSSGKKPEDVEMAMQGLRDGVIGAFKPAQTPFGLKPVVYADWTASGRGYGPLEDYIRNKVVPFYANTHTTSSLTGLQSTLFREEARKIIGDSVHATSDDLVIFTGTGATGAVNKLVTLLGLDFSGCLDIRESARPVVLVGPFEHHSNLLPWRESNAEVINVPERKNGPGADQEVLEQLLKQYKNRPLIVGSFSAGSNVTGVLEDVNGVSSLLHRYGALACWDYAAAGPYAHIDMNPELPKNDPNYGLAYKDAAFISVHKFVGGLGTPGVLVVKKKHCTTVVPHAGNIGGGTVAYVREDGQLYLHNAIEREEGGTPDIVGAIRAGLTFKLKESVGWENIEKREVELGHLVNSKLGAHPKISLLGPKWGQGPRLSIVTFVIRHGNRFLHHNFVSAVLNDIFGIQTRGGCMCAGIYARRVLGIDYKSLLAMETEMLKQPEIASFIKFGFTRFSLSYFASEEEVNFILDAVLAVADHAWKLLPLYRYNTHTGEWKHKSLSNETLDQLWLKDAELFDAQGQKQPLDTVDLLQRGPTPDFDHLLAQGIEDMVKAAESSKVEVLEDQTKSFTHETNNMRWFVLPSEVYSQICEDREAALTSETFGPIDPSRYELLRATEMPHQYQQDIETISVESMSVSSDISSDSPNMRNLSSDGFHKPAADELKKKTISKKKSSGSRFFGWLTQLRKRETQLAIQVRA